MESGQAEAAPSRPTAVVVQPRAPYTAYRAGMDARALAEEAKLEEERDLNDDEPWSLPITHQITENLDRTNLEQASMDTAIPATNVGYRLLQKMGWRAGSGLGRDGSGIVEPIRAHLKEDLMGLGKKEQEDEIAEVATKRKALENEIERTDEEKRRKLDQHLEKEKIKEEVTQINKVFFCEICSKQYTQALQYDQHLSSYDHHHKKRLADMAKQARAMKKSFSKQDKKKKEERREQQMLKRLTEEANRKAAAAAAAGSEAPAREITLSSPPGGFQPVPPAPSVPPPLPPGPPPDQQAASPSPFPSGFKPVAFTSTSSSATSSTSGAFQSISPSEPPRPPSGFQPVTLSYAQPRGGFQPIPVGGGPAPPRQPPPPSTPAPLSQPPPPPPPDDTPSRSDPSRSSGISFGLPGPTAKTKQQPMRFSFGGKK